MKATLFVLFICLSATLTSGERVEKEYESMFSEFMGRYNKNYTRYNFFDRYNIFKDNVDYIDKHNEENRSWNMAINEFGDITHAEFRKRHVGKVFTRLRTKISYSCDDFGFCSDHSIPEKLRDNLPTTWDWTTRGAVTPVKNQQSCGSCWAFSTTGALEGLHAITKGNLTSFSEQELVDCSGSFGDQGCFGGLMDDAFQFVKQKGICTEKSYPYEARDDTCKNCKSIFKIGGYHDVPTKQESALQNAAYTQPISVAIEGDHPSFQFYSSGVYDGDCGYTLDHGVLVVGWGVESGKDYWKVKNSWGGSWGDEGYILLARNVADKRGQCGIAMQPSYPVM